MKRKISPFIDEILISKTEVIYNGIDLMMFKNAGIDLNEKYSIDKGKQLLLSVGRVVKGKGYKDKYEIFKKLIQEGYPYHWIIVGDGEYLKELKEEAINDGIIDTISFMGRLERNEIAQIYASVNVFWLLSNFDESLGLVYLESIASGTKVIARNKAGAIETVNEQSGFLINNNDECYELLKLLPFEHLSNDIIIKSLQAFEQEQNIDKLVQVLQDNI